MATATGPERVMLVSSSGVPGPVRDAVAHAVSGALRLDVASNLKAGLAAVEANPFDAVLYFFEEPSHDHWADLGNLLSRLPATPVLVLSSTREKDAAERAIKMGAQDFLNPTELPAGGLDRPVRFAVERHRIVRERQAGLDRLRQLERFKTEFINTAAHELNSPLTPVRLQLHLLKGQLTPGLTQKQTSAVDIAYRNVERLIGLVEDILDAARLQSDRLVVRKQPIELDQILREAVESQRAAADKAGIKLVVDVAPDLRTQADPARVAQVVYNLLGNAIKFTPPAGTITVSGAREGEWLVARVKDTGIGLRQEDFARLFQPFSQTHEWTHRKIPGSGLGLYICQGIVEQHGGRIWCDSPGPNKGSKFAFALPVLAPAAAEAPPQPAPETAPPKPRKHRTVWSIVYFKCPTCGSRDINMRILKNKYECRACTDEWR